MEITEYWEAKPLGTWSVAGQQPKIVATVRHQLACNKCGWSVLGQLREDGYFADMKTQVFPPDTRL
jgi:hypothetical protein